MPEKPKTIVLPGGEYSVTELMAHLKGYGINCCVAGSEKGLTGHTTIPLNSNCSIDSEELVNKIRAELKKRSGDFGILTPSDLAETTEAVKDINHILVGFRDQAAEHAELPFFVGYEIGRLYEISVKLCCLLLPEEEAIDA